MNSNHILSKSVGACVVNAAMAVVSHGICRKNASAAVEVAKITIKHERILPVSHTAMKQSGEDQQRETSIHRRESN